jgi:tetratricopeptide (TPR) repeat protein
MNSIGQQLIAAVILGSLSTSNAASYSDARKEAAQIVSELQRADYEGNQVTMQKCHDQLTPLLKNTEIASCVRYWQGFAMWRKAINGFNDSVDPNELEQDLDRAIEEFKQSIATDPKYVEAKIGLISSLGYLAFMNMKNQERAKQLVGQIKPLVKEATEAAPDNPRLIWVRGPILWNTPAERDGGQDKAIENYKRGLEIISKIKPSADPLEPSWGKPELLMNLAYSYLNKNTPDLNAAERDARAALEIVPYWHYVRDILLPQILAAKEKAK